MCLHGSYKQGHEALLAQVKGSLKNAQGLQLAVSGDLRHSMTNLTIVPPVLGLDGALGQSDTLTEGRGSFVNTLCGHLILRDAHSEILNNVLRTVIVGQMRVRVMETLYSLELRHLKDPGDSLDKEEIKGIKEFHVAQDWLCVWLGVEHLCVNMSRRLGNWGMGEVYTRLTHSLHLLNATGNLYFSQHMLFTHYNLPWSQTLCHLDAGVPASSGAQVRWAQDGGRLSALAELQTGTEHIKAEIDGGTTEQDILRWEYVARLQHQVKALLKSGISSSIQAKAHYQVQDYNLLFCL